MRCRDYGTIEERTSISILNHDIPAGTSVTLYGNVILTGIIGAGASVIIKNGALLCIGPIKENVTIKVADISAEQKNKKEAFTFHLLLSKEKKAAYTKLFNSGYSVMLLGPIGTKVIVTTFGDAYIPIMEEEGLVLKANSFTAQSVGSFAYIEVEESCRIDNLEANGRVICGAYKGSTVWQHSNIYARKGDIKIKNLHTQSNLIANQTITISLMGKQTTLEANEDITVENGITDGSIVKTHQGKVITPSIHPNTFVNASSIKRPWSLLLYACCCGGREI